MDATCASEIMATRNFKLLKWWQDNGGPWGPDNALSAAEDGLLQTMKWMKENGFSDWVADACSGAAKKGCLQTLKWLIAEGCPFDQLACVNDAARYGHLQTLKWLQEIGCSFSQESVEESVSGGFEEVAQWLRERVSAE